MSLTAFLSIVGAGIVVAFLASSVWAAKLADPGLKARVAAAAGFAPDCTTVTVSTVNTSWARLDTVPLNGCPAGNGFVVMHFAKGKWHVVDQASEPFSCALDNIPAKVGKDIRVCTPAKTFILCRVTDRDFRRALEHPKRCDTLGPRDSFSEAANLANLSWRNWGQSKATASGVDRGYRLPYSTIRVSVKAYRRVIGDCGDFIYTRLRVNSQYGTLTVKFPSLCGDSY